MKGHLFLLQSILLKLDLLKRTVEIILLSVAQQKPHFLFLFLAGLEAPDSSVASARN